MADKIIRKKNMHKYIIKFIVLFTLAVVAKAAPPNPEPFDVAFERFVTTYIQQCEEIMRELPVNYAEKEKDFEVLSGYLNNVRTDDISGIRRTINDNAGLNLPYWLRRLTGDIVGFRRVLDQLIITNLANNNLRFSEQLQKRLKKYWDAERYYSWRFSYEADMVELGQGKSSQPGFEKTATTRGRNGA